MLSEVCNAQQTCSTEQLESISTGLLSCDTNCLADVCNCCTEALDAGSSNSNYDCCSSYSQALQCTNFDSSLYAPCSSLTTDEPSGATMTTAVCAVSGVMILLSAVINQIILWADIYGHYEDSCWLLLRVLELVQTLCIYSSCFCSSCIMYAWINFCSGCNAFCKFLCRFAIHTC